MIIYKYDVNIGVKFLYLNCELKRILKYMIAAVFSPTLKGLNNPGLKVSGLSRCYLNSAKTSDGPTIQI